MGLHEVVPIVPLAEWGKAHFIGVGGVSMSGIAAMVHQRGVPTSGSDREDSAALQRLADAGVDVSVGHAAEHLADADTVVVTTAIGDSNPELAEARRRGLRILHRSTALACLTHGSRLVAVTGSHGKTTTSAMVVTALASLDPSYMVGSVVTATGVGAHTGSSDVFVIEADESDGSYLQFEPTVAVVTNVEADHLDNWGTPENYVQGFERFLALPSLRHAVLCGDDPVLAAMRPGIEVVRYGTAPGNDVIVGDVTEQPGGISGSLARGGDRHRLSLPVPGRYNLLNAAAAWCVSTGLGVEADVAADALAGFGGTARRFERVAEVDDVLIVDDYAHHPTEVTATLTAARTLGRRVVAVFQPHLFTRTRDFAAEFARALSAADVVVVTDIYPAREEPIEGVTGQLIADAVQPGAQWVPELDDVPVRVAELVRPGDVVLTVGAGSITRVGPQLAALLRGE